MMAGAVGQWMQQIALGWLALVTTNSPSFVGIVTFAAGVPFIIVGPPAGNLIDRVDRRRLLLVCQLLAAVLALIVAVDIFAGSVQPWHLLAAAFLNGCLLSLMTPTQQSLVPSLVDRADLTNAIALMSAGQNLTRVAGPSVAGIMIAWWGVGPAFLSQAVMLVVAFALIFRIRLPARTKPAAVASNLFDGIRIVWSMPEIRVLFLMVAISMFFVFPYLSFINVFARDLLHIGASGLGILMASSGSGAVVGALFVAARGRASGVGPALVILAVLYGIVILGVAISTWAVLSAILMFTAGLVGSVIFSLNTALVQHRIQDEVRGRVMSAYFLTWGLMPLGALPMGLVADYFGARVAVGAGAVISSVLVAVLGVRSPQIRNL
jgi:predicted MFS family arabinose efflux permease